jgi:hypothetical protein
MTFYEFVLVLLDKHESAVGIFFIGTVISVIIIRQAWGGR